MQKNSWDGRKAQKELHGITGETVNKVCNAEKVLSPDWSDLQMKIDGRLICLPSPYHEFVALGWDFRISDYDCDRYILLPGYNSDCIVLTNQEYIGNRRDDYYAYIRVCLRNCRKLSIASAAKCATG